MRTEKKVKVSTLQALTPLSKLPAEVLAKLSSITYFETDKAGVKICDQGAEEPWSFYLLSGELTVTTEEGYSKSLVGGTAMALEPVNFIKPSCVTAVAKSNIVYIKIQDAILAKAWGDSAPTREGKTNETLDVESLRKKVLADIQRDYKANKLVIPSLPDIAIKIREAVNDPETEAEDVTRIVQMDPALAARIVQVANSPVYRGGKAIDNCRMAISRLGLTTTRDLVVSCTLQQLFKSNSPVLNEALLSEWQKATLLGAISAIIARYTRGIDEDRSLLAGLVSNIGVLPIIAYLEKYPQLASDKAVFQQMVDEHAIPIGTMVLQHWDFDKDIISVVGEANDWFRDTTPEADYCDVVILAKYFAATDGEQVEELPDVTSLPAFNRISQGRLGDSVGAKLLEAAQDEIEEIQRMLQGK